MRPWVIYVSFWYRYSVARRHRRCTSQSIAVRHDKPVGHKTEISQPPKYNAAINRNRNSPLPFNRNAEGEGEEKKMDCRKPVPIFARRDRHALFATKSRPSSRLPRSWRVTRAGNRAGTRASLSPSDCNALLRNADTPPCRPPWKRPILADTRLASRLEHFHDRDSTVQLHVITCPLKRSQLCHRVNWRI